MAQEMTIVGGEFSDVTFQRTDVGLLPDRPAGVGDAGHHSREILDPGDCVMRLQKISRKLFKIKPFVWRVFQCPIVQIESVDV